MHRFLGRLVTGCLVVCLCAAVVLFPRLAWADEDAPALEEATAACVIDAYGNVLYSKNVEEEMPLASITKVMTAMVALDAGIPLDQQVSIQLATYQEDAQLAGFEDGDVVTFGDLLMVALVYSGNDAASNLAYVVAGDEASFAELMNAKAAEIGMEHTHFANPHGLEQDGHYSCAADLCKMGRYALEHYPFIRNAVKTRSIDVVVGGQTITLYSTDELMETYEGLRGIKTGMTESGCSFLGSARRGGVTLYSCVLCCDTSDGRFEDTRILLDWAYGRYEGRRLANAAWTVRLAPWQDGFWLSCPVSAQRDVSGLSYEGGGVSYTTVMYKPDTFVRAGSTYGTTVWTQDQRLVGSVTYRSSRPTRGSAWNVFLQPLFDAEEGEAA